MDFIKMKQRKEEKESELCDVKAMLVGKHILKIITQF